MHLTVSTMKLAQFAARAFLAAASASAFTPCTGRLGVRSKHAVYLGTTLLNRKVGAKYHKSTALSANILKLSEPNSQLLSKIDALIFDCDGVIWRVSHETYDRSRLKLKSVKLTHLTLDF
jgi:hypothetical protein